MLRIFQHLFPNISVSDTTIFHHSYPMSITVNSKIYPFLVSSNTIPILDSNYSISSSPNSSSSNIFITENFDNYALSLPFNLLFDTAHQLQIISASCQKENFFQELLITHPSFLNTKLLQESSLKELKNLFHLMLTKKLATIPMLALFFHGLSVEHPEQFFSQQTGKEILYELNRLSQNDIQLFSCIQFLIERNIILLILENAHLLSLDHIKNNILLNQKYMLQYSLSKILLSNFHFFKKKQKLPIIFSQIPRNALVSFLQYSPQNNISLIQQAFSKEGYNQLLEDIHNTSLSIEHSIPLLKRFAQEEYKAFGNSFENLIKNFSPLDLEMLAREVDIRDFFQALSSTENKKISGHLYTLYEKYQKKILIFPIHSNNMAQSLEICGSAAIYVQLITGKQNL